MNKILVVLSGGQDSTTCLFWAKKLGAEVHAITFNYGQRHAAEIEAAKKVAELAGVASHEIIDVPGILKSASPLTSDTELEQYADADSMAKTIGSRVEVTFVPMRNTLFLTIAVNRAVAMGAGLIVTGICQEDNANYPDCTDAFRMAFEQLANLSLGIGSRLHIAAPLIHMSKSQSVHFANTLPGCMEALAYTLTSYDGKYPPTDMNHANVLRAKGFEEAGIPDPLVLRAVYEGLMTAPKTANYNGFVATK